MLRFQAAIVISALCCLVPSPAVAAPKPNDGVKPSFGTKPSNGTKPKSEGKANAPTLKSVSTKEVSALQLDQTHIYLGKVKVILTPDAIKMVGLGKFHFTLVSKAPDWNVTAFREDDKLYCTQPFGVFCDQGLFSNLVMVQKERMMPRGSKPTKDALAGVAVKRYAWTNVVFKCLPLEGNAAPQAEPILHAGYKVPTNGQIPLSFEVVLTGKDWMTHLSEEGMHRSFLSTQKISRRRVSMSEFEVPSGLAKEKSVTRIVIGDANKLKDTGADVLFKLD